MLKESVTVFENIKGKKVAFVSKGAEKIFERYSIKDYVERSADRVIYESLEGSPFFSAGIFYTKKFDAVIVSPATANTVAKIVRGIADTLVTNVVAQAIKNRVRLYAVPTDIEKDTHIRWIVFLPDKCDCDICYAEKKCRYGAVKKGKIDIMRCRLCGECIEVCKYCALKIVDKTINVRDVDIKNVERLATEAIVLKRPEEILKLL